jgi:flagellar assembly protein FliH
MTSSSSFAPLATPELRSGDLTRFGDASALGDAVTEHVLGNLVAEARQAARAQGYSVGWAEGRRAAAAQAAEDAARRADEVADQQARAEREHLELLRSVAAAAQALAGAADRARALVEEQAVDLARELTETMVGHELRSAPDTAADVAARVLAEAPSGAPFELRVHPATAGALTGSEIGTAFAETGVRVVSDPSLAFADAVVEIDDRVLDLRISSALERVREVLS